MYVYGRRYNLLILLSPLACVQQECSREGGISLPRVASDDVGIRPPPEVAGSCPDQQTPAGASSSMPTDDCPMTDDDEADAGTESAKGPIELQIAIEDANGSVNVRLTTVDDCAGPEGSSEAAQGVGSKGARIPAAVQPAIDYVPGQPLLEYTDVRQAQEAWQASREYRVPTLTKYSAQQDTGITWQQRMSAVQCALPLLLSCLHCCACNSHDTCDNLCYSMKYCTLAFLHSLLQPERCKRAKPHQGNGQRTRQHRRSLGTA